MHLLKHTHASVFRILRIRIDVVIILCSKEEKFISDFSTVAESIWNHNSIHRVTGKKSPTVLENEKYIEFEAILFTFEMKMNQWFHVSLKYIQDFNVFARFLYKCITSMIKHFNSSIQSISHSFHFHKLFIRCIMFVFLLEFS